ncbi:mannose-specific lectin-like [Dioscorea cayenensis subsp. rotundata]|uniref:Mannose-specific lectin-like n=1 Tax=Dioscorea cayennensis subsp. rotundata TaxID=55577 RepID=A0AB40D0D7_DIOCR|nr:mannose-specific lectin-like [Dioscorea cayenensis subsp. rotundata]
MAIPSAFASHSLALALALLLVVTPLCTAKIILYSGETLKTKKSLVWKSYTFIMQEDCNAVLYDHGKPIWVSQTYSRGTRCYITLQSDGNLVIYDDSNTAVWASNTNLAEATYVLIIQKDRNLVLYGAACWATNTNIGGSAGAMFIKSKATIFGALPANKTTEEAKASGTISMVINN